MGNKKAHKTSPGHVDDTMEIADPTIGDNTVASNDTGRHRARSVLAAGAVASALACTAAYRRRAHQREQQGRPPAASPTSVAVPKTA